MNRPLALFMTGAAMISAGAYLMGGIATGLVTGGFFTAIGGIVAGITEA